MISQEKISERALSYCVFKDGDATGTTYNSLAAASTVATDANPAVTSVAGKGIPVAKFRKALVTVIYGTLGASTTGAITLAFGQRLTKADSATTTALADWAINYTDADANTVVKGEVNLEFVPNKGAYERILWVKHAGTGDHITIVVTLMDPITGYSGETLATGADFPGSLV